MGGELIVLALGALVYLAWQLRLVILMLFGAVVVGPKGSKYRDPKTGELKNQNVQLLDEAADHRRELRIAERQVEHRAVHQTAPEPTEGPTPSGPAVDALPNSLESELVAEPQERVARHPA